MNEDNYNESYSELDIPPEQDDTEEFINSYNKHYIKTREDGTIIYGWSDGLEPNRDTSNAICINDKACYQFRLIFHEPKIETYIDMDGNEVQGETRIVETFSEENPSLYDFDGTPLYKYEDGEIRLLSKIERAIEKAKLENKQLPLIKT